MADLSEKLSGFSTKVIGSDNSGNESNYLNIDINGALSNKELELVTFSSIFENITLANNKSMFAIYNTGTSIIKIHQIYLVNSMNTAITGVVANFRLSRISSHSGGTAITPEVFDTTDSLPLGINLSTGATVTETGSALKIIEWSTDEWGSGTLDQEGSDHGFQESNPFWKTKSGQKKLTIRQNQGIHLKCATNTTNGSFTFFLVFTTE